MYFSESTRGSLRFWSKQILGSIGISLNLDPNVLVFSKKSIRNFLWDNKDFSESEQPRYLKISQAIKVFHMEMRTQISIQLNYILIIISSDNNIININCKNNSAGTKMSHKYRVIRGASSKFIVCNNSTEFVKPCTWKLLQTIDYLFEFVDLVCLPLNLITRAQACTPLENFHSRMHF